MPGFAGMTARKGPRLNHRQRPVALRPAVAEELPGVAHLAQDGPVHIGDDELVLVLARLGDQLAAWIDEIGRAVEAADVPRRLGADAVDGADEAAIGDR